ncbi:MAG: DUF4864 domain-containing protein [Devosiaceae bacterium]|nr:DUF4864 domain-containing protein [Devosiaceae bacterium MH13]
MTQYQSRAIAKRSNSAVAAAKAQKAAHEGLVRFALTVLAALAALSFALAFALTDQARAQEQPQIVEVPGETAQSMRNIITAQIDAFRSNDAEAAYAFASPSIKMQFPSATQFISMVQSGYPAVYSPQSYEFVGSALTPRGPAQRVEFVAEDGQVWGGLYTFFEGSDGELSISGVFLRRENARQI